MFFLSEAEDESTKPKENLSARKKKVHLSDDEDEDTPNKDEKDNDNLGILDENDDLERDEQDKEFSGLCEPLNNEFKLGGNKEKENSRTT